MFGRWFQTVFVCSLTVLFTGCGDKDPSLDELVKYSSQALGIPVLLWAKSNDLCASKQIRSFYDEYQKASEEEQQQLVNKFKGYSAIIVQMSENVGTVQRMVYEVQYSNKKWRSVGAWKSSSGALPGTRIELGGDDDGSPRDLYITPFFANDLSVKTIYKTTEPRVMEALGNYGLDYLEVARYHDFVSLISVRQAVPTSCGKLATFADILGKK